MVADKGAFQWLKPTFVGYAYRDAPDILVTSTWWRDTDEVAVIQA